MSLTIELLPAQEQQIQQEAERAGVSVSEIVRRALDARFPVTGGASNGKAREDAPLNEEERAEEERIFAQLHANINETRRSLEMRTL